MSAALGLAASLADRLAAATTPTPSPTATLPADVAPDPNSVTPGLLGFLVVFVLAIVLWLLFRNLTGKLRRMRFREDQRLADDAAQAAVADRAAPGGPRAPRPGRRPADPAADGADGAPRGGSRS